MGKGVILFIIIVVIAAAAAFFYYAYEKPKQEAAQQTFHNLSIRSYNAHTAALLPADYVVDVEGEVFHGRTLSSSFVLQRIPTNKSFTVNVQHPGYYVSYSEHPARVVEGQLFRIEHPLYPVGQLDVSASAPLGHVEPLPITLTADGWVKHVQMCIRWSNNFVSASLQNQTLTNIPRRWQNKVDKCYDINATFKDNDAQTLYLNYRQYLDLAPTDSIKLVILYGDINPQQREQFIFEGEQGNAVARNDTIVVLSPG